MLWRCSSRSVSAVIPKQSTVCPLITAWGFVFRFGLLSALGLTFAVFLPLSVCPRSLSSGFFAVSSDIGGFSRFRRSVDRLRLSDTAPCALGGLSCPRRWLLSFLPCLRCFRGLGLLVGRCPSFGRGLLGSLVPFTFLSAF